ncbi:protein toll-like [Saccostrea echinata]|uniref:protein toll-like n=1 Tax=Saccostrea echinata TaxID=191078 RepID=UPI002A81D4CD|nr:protein toll-like [Saccostrea echinata]
MIKSREITLSVIWILTTPVVSNGSAPVGFFKWQDPENSRTDLFCPTSCKHDFCDLTNILLEEEEMNRMCRCKAVPLWEINNELEYVYLEYSSRVGRGWVVSSEDSRGAKPQSLTHKNEFLTSLPENICSFHHLVKVDFSDNELTDIRGINCLTYLDTLILKGNKLKTIHNETFHGMTNLRVLDLSLNEVKRIEPYTLSGSTLGLYLVDVSHNKLKSLDVTNFAIKQPFCQINYNDNQIEEITNELSIQVNLETTFGDGGFVNLQRNMFTKFLNFTKLGVSDLTQLGKVFNFGFDLRGCKLTCDATLVPFLKLSKEIIEKMWRNYFDVKCFQPPELANQSIAWLTKEGQLDRFITNVTENCPTGCHCYQQPSQDRTVVNCTNKNMTQLPKKIPHDQNITLILKGNQISQIKNMSYLERVSYLDISENNVQNIPESVANTLVLNEIKLNLNGNKLQKIPSRFKTRDPCDLNIGKLNMTCDCSNDWMDDWLGGGCHNNSAELTDIYCVAPSYSIPDSEFDFTNCEEHFDFKSLSIGIAILLLLLSGILAIFYYFRYEIFLLRKRLRQARKHSGQYKYDIYISVRENNGQLLMWIQSILLPFLNSKSYNVYFRPLDEAIGSVKEESIIDNVKDSRNFIVILSSDYINDDNDTIWTRIEWKHAWNCFKEESNVRNKIIINYDHLRSSIFPTGPFKAYLRLGLAIDFSNRKHKLLEEVEERLGVPNKNYYRKQLGLMSSKPKFCAKFYNQHFYSDVPDTNAKYSNVKNPYVVSEDQEQLRNKDHSEEDNGIPGGVHIHSENNFERLGFYSMTGYKTSELVHIDIV